MHSRSDPRAFRCATPPPAPGNSAAPDHEISPSKKVGLARGALAPGIEEVVLVGPDGGRVSVLLHIRRESDREAVRESIERWGCSVYFCDEQVPA